MLTLYARPRLFWGLTATIFLCLIGFVFPFFFALAKPLLLLLLLVCAIDILMLFGVAKGIEAERLCPQRLSNGDENEIKVKIVNYYRFPAKISVIDEAPEQLQLRNLELKKTLADGMAQTLSYWVRPTRRGEYKFGYLNVYATSPIGLFSRRFRQGQAHTVPVYPSFLQMRRYELLAISNRLTEVGVKRIRRVGHNMEFDQIREYVQGDDNRDINWKATARKNSLMVNQYQDERSQQIYCIIDKGRAMQMPFEGMTLLDYAINASLVLSNIAIQKQDKAGLITFNTDIRTWLPASNRKTHVNNILEALYAEKTAFKESDFEKLFVNVKRRLSQRSLLIIFTNFETLSSLERQIKYFRSIAKSHLLVVVFFENTEIRELLEVKPSNTQQVYVRTIAEKFVYEKRLIAKELQKYGIFSVFTAPQNLTVNTINQYLELKARGLI